VTRSRPRFAFHPQEKTSLGKLRYFLGMEINDVDDGLLLNQKRYATELLAAAGMSDCKPVSTPMETGVAYVKRKKDEEQADGAIYRSVVEGLQYLCNTRPDIQYAVGVGWSAGLYLTRHRRTGERSRGSCATYKELWVTGSSTAQEEAPL